MEILKEEKTEEEVIAQANREQDELTMLFEHHDTIFNAEDDDGQRGGCLRTLLNDEDYAEDNRTYNRVKNYSFART